LSDIVTGAKPCAPTEIWLFSLSISWELNRAIAAAENPVNPNLEQLNQSDRKTNLLPIFLANQNRIGAIS
jgi:hypothetical protein